MVVWLFHKKSKTSFKPVFASSTQGCLTRFISLGGTQTFDFLKRKSKTIKFCSTFLKTCICVVGLLLLSYHWASCTSSRIFEQTMGVTEEHMAAVGKASSHIALHWLNICCENSYTGYWLQLAIFYTWLSAITFRVNSIRVTSASSICSLASTIYLSAALKSATGRRIAACLAMGMQQSNHEPRSQPADLGVGAHCRFRPPLSPCVHAVSGLSFVGTQEALPHHTGSP